MDRPSVSALLSVHEYYCKHMQEGENMRVRLQALLNEVSQKRVLMKEMHIEFAVKYTEHMSSYKNRLDEVSGDYETMTKYVIARREKILKLCHAALKNDVNYNSNNNSMVYKA